MVLTSAILRDAKAEVIIMEKQAHPLQFFGALVIDYFRWTQLTPMVLMWAIVVGLALLVGFVGYQDQIFNTADAVARWVAQLPGIGPRFTAWIEAKEVQDAAAAAAKAGEETVPAGTTGDGSDALDELKLFVLKAWSVLSLVAMGISSLVNRLFGPFEPWTLKRKLRLVALLCLIFPLAFGIAEFAAPDMVHGSLSSILISSIGLMLLYFIVSAWCLTISHFLGLWRNQLMNREFGKPKKDERLL